MTGRIVILNGAPRSGKSTIARAMQSSLEGRWMNLGVDAVMATTPEHWRPGIGLRPGGERPDLEPIILELYRGLFISIAALARSDIDIVSDLGIHESYSQPIGILGEMVNKLADLPVLFVGVRCDLREIMRRRSDDPVYSADPAVAEHWDTAVHDPGVYDLTLDTSAAAPEACVEAIRVALADPPAPAAIRRLLSLKQKSLPPAGGRDNGGTQDRG
jgi:chloramphenicol 3-O phosphotransferase